MNRRTSGWILLVTIHLAFLSSSASGEEWPQFLGPQRNGISMETGLMEAWPEGGPPEVWRVPGGVGMSGLAISQGKLLTLIQNEEHQTVVALDPKDGARLWETPIAPAYSNAMGDGPRATPTIAGSRVFVFSGQGILAALNLADGKLLWKTDALAQFQAAEADYGMACSPLVAGNQVIVTVGAPKATVVAFDVHSGQPTWQVGSDPTGYSSPALLNLGGKSQVVVFTGGSAMGLQPASGELLWRFPYETDFGCNIATPLIVGKNQVFISSGENHGCALLAIKADEAGGQPDVVWSSYGPKSVLRNEWQTSILLEGYLYGFDNVGGAGPVSHLTCVEAATGKRVWQEARFGKGNMIAAEGKLFIVTLDGELVVAAASPEGYQQLGSKQVVGKTRQAPALYDGRLYLRDDRDIVALDVRKP